MKSRYIAFTQQPYCCVPTCLQIIMYRRGIPLVEQETLGYELGLTVPEEDAKFFGRVRTGEKPKSGWGTQISKNEFSIDSAMQRLGISLKSCIHTIDKIDSAETLHEFFQKIQIENKDTLVCFRNESDNGGHVCVFDQLEGDKVWLVDPERSVPKHRKVKLEDLYQSMLKHGAANSAGVWEICEKDIKL